MEGDKSMEVKYYVLSQEKNNFLIGKQMSRNA